MHRIHGTSGQSRSPRLLVRQSEHDQPLISSGLSRGRSRNIDREVLLAVTPLVGHGNRFDVVVERRRPELLSRAGVERAEQTVIRRPDERQPTGGDDRAALRRQDPGAVRFG